MATNLPTMRRRPGGTNPTTMVKELYSTAFSPTSIAGCQLWLDGADPAGNGVIPSPGTIITTWADKSGLGNNGTGFNSPTYSSTRSVNFVRASSQYFTLPNGTLPFNNTSYSYFIVATVNDNTVRSGFIGGGAFGGSGQVTALRTESGSTNALIQYWWGNDMASGNNVWSTNVPFISGWFYTTGSTFSTWVNGTSVVSGNPGTRSQPNIGNTVGVTNGSELMSGTISEILVYGAGLVNSTQQRTIESYLAQKWGLTGALPANHQHFTQPAGKPNTVTNPTPGLFPVLKPQLSSPITSTVLNTIATYLRNYMSEFRNPSFYGYTLDGNSYFINDGGNDMYDTGNWTYPWLIAGTQYTAASGSQLAFSINYANTTATTVDTDFIYVSLGYTQGATGASSVHPLTVLGFRTSTGTPVGFQLAGNSGADGSGTLSSGILYAGDIIQGFTVHAFYRETYAAFDPSHCNLFILLGHPSWGSVFGTISSFADPVANGGNGCYFFTSGAGVSNILAIQTLLSKASAALVTAAECQTVVQAFVNRIKLVLGF